MMWAENFLADGESLYIGFRGYEKDTKKHIINMDYSIQPGIRTVTRKINLYRYD